MKARIPPRRAMSKAQREIIDEYMDEAAERFAKIACAVLHEEYGFGKQRLNRFLKKVTEAPNDEIMWWHIDKLLIDQMGLPFHRDTD